MWRLRKPSAEEVRALLAAQGASSFSYDFVGAIAAADEVGAPSIPAGFDRDCTRQKVGSGDRAFTAACDGLRAWKHFPPEWTEVWPGGELAEGLAVVMLARIWGVWLVNLCRVVRVVDEEKANGGRRFGFAYGTLRQHLSAGRSGFLSKSTREATCGTRFGPPPSRDGGPRGSRIRSRDGFSGSSWRIRCEQCANESPRR